jgi:hypothetical protein
MKNDKSKSINHAPNPLKGTPCHADNCYAKIVHTQYCVRHYKQMKRHGKTFDTIYQKRPAIIEGDIAKIPLGVGAKDGYAIVDVEFAWLDKYKWIARRGYAISHIKNKPQPMHRLVTSCPKGMVVDHINHDTLDNRKVNLRICTHAENMMNMVIPKDNKSGVKGVFWDSNKGKWHAKLQVRNKPVFIGYFMDLEIAARAYDKAAKKHFGEFALINKIGEK